MADSILDKVLSSKHAEEISQFAPRDILNRLLAPLTSRERDIIIRRFGLAGGEAVTLEGIGASIKVTRERVRQIERSAIKKIRDGQHFNMSIVTVEHVIRQCLEDAGGALPQQELFERLVVGRDTSSEARASIIFFLTELLKDRFQRIEGDKQLRDGWALHVFPLERLRRQMTALENIFHNKNTPLSFADVSAFYRTERSEEAVTDDQLQSLLGLSTLLQQNVFGEWGLTAWATITPKRMRDKIYLVLKRHGKPLHFNEIVNKINEAHFDQKVAYAPTVHNELIMDKRFVLVGRGIYALAQWGFKPGIVSDVVADILQKEGAPLHRDVIVERVLAQRFVGKATVHLALMNRNRFTKMPDGRYTLATSIYINKKGEHV